MGAVGEATAALLDGIASSGSEPAGWDAVVKPRLAEVAYGCYLLTYSLTYLLTHSLTYLRTYLLTYLLTYVLTHLLT